MAFYTQYLRPFIELLYFISAPVVAYFAYRALEQIKVARGAAKTMSKRESIRLAAMRCEYFDKEVVAANKELFTVLKEKRIEFLNKSEVEINNDCIKVKPYKDKQDLTNLLNQIELLAKLINRLELFAMYFTGGIADEEFAYLALGRPYCEFVRKILPLLMIGSFKNDCKHILRLFLLWYPRIQEQVSGERKRELEKELSDLDGKVYCKKKITPIGT